MPKAAKDDSIFEHRWGQSDHGEAQVTQAKD